MIESDLVTKVGINYILQGCERLTSLTIPPMRRKVVGRWRLTYPGIKIVEHCYIQGWLDG